MLRLILIFALASAGPAAAKTLPLHGPWPVPRPDGRSEASTPNTTKVPAKKRDKGAADPTGNADESKADPPIPAPIEKEDPGSYAVCLAELRRIGVDFSETRSIDDGQGCGIDRPIEVRSLGGGIALAPAATLRCRTAANLARWTHDVVVPMLGRARPEEALASLEQASAYVCRKRGDAGTKISEHARGTAIDIAGFTFRSGRTFEIAPREKDSTLNGAFQRAIAAAACLHFSTVLDPASDAAHDTHLHLDTLKRSGGYRYCW